MGTVNVYCCGQPGFPPTVPGERGVPIPLESGADPFQPSLDGLNCDQIQECLNVGPYPPGSGRYGTLGLYRRFVAPTGLPPQKPGPVPFPNPGPNPGPNPFPALPPWREGVTQPGWMLGRFFRGGGIPGRISTPEGYRRRGVWPGGWGRVAVIPPSFPNAQLNVGPSIHQSTSSALSTTQSSPSPGV